MPLRYLAVGAAIAGLGASSSSRSASPTAARGSRRSWIRGRTPATPGFQSVQGQIALGSGGLLGRGLGQSVQKIFYLPEAHTDFILAIIGEELGVVGIFGALFLYGLIAYAGLRVAKAAVGPYAKLVAAGVTSLILCQALPERLHRARPRAADGRAAAVHLLRLDEPHRCCSPGWGCCSTSRRRAAPSCGPVPGSRAMAPSVLIAAGGTAGHVVPALAVADALRAEGARGRLRRRGARRARARPGRRLRAARRSPSRG